MANSGQFHNLVKHKALTMYKKLSIKEWAVEDRPREKMLVKGIRSLSEAELVAILIGSGNLDESAVEVSRRILASVNNNLNELGKKNHQRLTQIQRHWRSESHNHYGSSGAWTATKRIGTR